MRVWGGAVTICDVTAESNPRENKNLECNEHPPRYVPYFTYLTALNVSRSAVEKVRKKGNKNEKREISFPTSEG